MDKESMEMIEALDGNSDAPTITLVEGEGEVTIYKATAKQLFLILELLKALLKQFNFDASDDPLAQAEKLQTLSNRIKDPIFLVELLMENFDRMKKLVAELCSLSEDEIDKLGLDNLVLVIYAEWTVNERFFTRRVMPMIQQLGIVGQSQELPESKSDSTTPEPSPTA